MEETYLVWTFNDGTANYQVIANNRKDAEEKVGKLIESGYSFALVSMTECFIPPYKSQQELLEKLVENLKDDIDWEDIVVNKLIPALRMGKGYYE